MKWKPVVPLGLALSLLCACAHQEGAVTDVAVTAELVGTEWQWLAFEDNADGDEGHPIDVSEPTRFTLTLLPANHVSIRADCNWLRWTYTLQGSALTFNTLGPGTRAYCGDDSLDRRYLELLGNTATYVLADGKLYLNLKYDSGNLVFAP